MRNKFKTWWQLDPELEQASPDNPLTALTADQRRDALPLLTVAFGWGFLVTGLFVGSAPGAGVNFWPGLIYATFLGNFTNFVIGALVGYIGYKSFQSSSAWLSTKSAALFDIKMGHEKLNQSKTE